MHQKCGEMQINVGLDQVHKMSGISLVTRIRNIQLEPELIGPPQPGFGKQRGGTRPSI